MQKIFLTIIFIFSTSVFGIDLPEDKPEFLPPDKAFKMSVTNIGEKKILIDWQIEKGYYLYMGMFEFSTDQENVKITKAQMPDGTKKVDEFFGNVDVYYNSTSAELTFDKINHADNKFLEAFISEQKIRLFDLRELWIRVMGDCRYECQRRNDSDQD